MEALFLGMGKTAIAPDELVTEVSLPHPAGTFQAYSKFGSRGANVIAVVNVALCLWLDGRKISRARVAYGSVAPKPFRAEAVEQFLTGRELSEALATESREAVKAAIAPIDDVRGSKHHKTRLAVNATEDALLRAFAERSNHG
jgi:carbon-monoxide dehydrogenase medium subunit